MSAPPQDPGSPADPSQLHGEGSVDAHGDQAGGGNALAGQHMDIGSLIRAALVDGARAGPVGALDNITGADAAGAGAHVYDGHVPLAFDSEFLPAIGSTLDLLTTTTDLFDVPVADFSPSAGDAAEA